MGNRLRRALRRERPTTLASDDPSGRRVVRFFRRFQRFHGGHLKVWDYFNHVRRSSDHVPVVTFATGSVFDETNPWATAGMRAIDPPGADVLFLAGRDWSRIPETYLDDERVPVINLIQHIRHTDPMSDLYEHLGRRAVRVCVGPELGDAVIATGKARGPVVVIPDGIDTAALAALRSDVTDVDLLIVATKNPERGGRLETALGAPGRRVRTLRTLLPRPTFLDEIAKAKVALFLPNPTEGFYLPALEAMALGTLAVCPDCVGNRSFCIPEQTAIRPDYRDADLIDAAERALALDAEGYATMTTAAMTTARQHDLSQERARFLAVLEDIDEMWRS